MIDNSLSEFCPNKFCPRLTKAANIASDH